MSNWIEATVVENYKWTHNLFSLKIKANVDKFIAGQYTKLGLKIDDNIVQRAYSFVNKPQSSTLEIYITTVKDGLLSPQLEKLKPCLTTGAPAVGGFLVWRQSFSRSVSRLAVIGRKGRLLNAYIRAFGTFTLSLKVK